VKIRFVLFIALIAYLFIGCTHNEENAIEIDEEEEIKIPTMPPDLSLITSHTSVPLTRYGYCWNENDCSLSPQNPKDVLVDQRPLRVTSGETLTFDTATSLSYKGQVIKPNIIEVTHIYKGNETKIDVSDKRLVAPEDKGTHYFNVYAKWEEEIDGEEVTGEAYHAFKLISE